VIPALADIGAGGGFADGVQLEALHQAFEIAVVVANRSRGFEPSRPFGLGIDGNQHS